eukprot:sb/3474527/
MLSVNKSDSYREMKALRDLYTVTKPKPVRRRVASATTGGSRNNNPVNILNVSNNRIPCLERLAYARPSGSRKLTPGRRPGVRADRQGISKCRPIMTRLGTLTELDLHQNRLSSIPGNIGSDPDLVTSFWSLNRGGH